MEAPASTQTGLSQVTTDSRHCQPTPKRLTRTPLGISRREQAALTRTELVEITRENCTAVLEAVDLPLKTAQEGQAAIPEGEEDQLMGIPEAEVHLYHQKGVKKVSN